MTCNYEMKISSGLIGAINGTVALAKPGESPGQLHHSVSMFWSESITSAAGVKLHLCTASSEVTMETVQICRSVTGAVDILASDAAAT